MPQPADNRAHLHLQEISPAASLIRRFEDGTISYWSPGAEALYGWRADEALGRVSHELLKTRFPEPPQRIEATVMEAGLWEGDLVHVSKSGELVQVRSRWAIHVDATGRPEAILEINTDVTQSRRTDEAFRVLFERSPVPIAVLDPDGVVILVNDALERQFGAVPGSLIGRSLDERTHPADLAVKVAARARLVDGTMPRLSLETRYLRIDGSAFLARLEVAAIRDAPDRAQYLIAMIEDITQTRAREAGRILAAQEHARADLERQFQAIFDRVSVGVAMATIEGELEDVNPAFSAITGYDRDRLIGRGIDGIVHRDDVSILRWDLARLAAGETPSFIQEVRFIRSDDSIARVLLTLSSLIDAHGLPTRTMAIVQDMTEVYRAEERRIITRRQLAETLSTAPIGLIVLDEAGKVAVAAGGVLLGAGFDPDRLSGTHLRDLSPDSLQFGALASRIVSGQRGTTSYTVQGREYEIFYGPLGPSPAGGGFIALAVDITDRLRADRATAQAEARSKFLASMSHELRTPLNAVLGFTQLLQERTFGALNERQERYLQHIRDGGELLLSLVNDVLDLSKISAGAMEMHLEPVGVTPVIEQCIEQMRPLAMAKGVDLAIASHSRAIAMADRRRLTQIVLNLLSNAVKFTEAGGAIRTSVAKRGAMVAVRVVDTGIGIPGDALAEMFEEFTQISNRQRPDQQGTGLGLPLSRQLARLMGGDLSAESTVGVGSTFRLLLRSAPEPADTPAA